MSLMPLLQRLRTSRTLHQSLDMVFAGGQSLNPFTDQGRHTRLMSLAGNGNKRKRSRTIPCLDAELHNMIRRTFHGPHVKIRGPNEPETEIERD